MTLKGRIGLALAVVASAAAVGVQQSPAQASVCPSTYLCAYQLTNYQGTPGKVAYNNDNLLQYPSFANAVSVSNSGTQCTVRIYSGLARSGSHVDIPRGYGIGNLAGTAYYHHIASNLWCP